MRPPEKTYEPRLSDSLEPVAKRNGVSYLLKGSSRQSRRIIISASFLLLIHLPVRSQVPIPSQKPHWSIPPKDFHVFSTPTPTVGPIVLSVSPSNVEADGLVSFELMFDPPPGLEIDYQFVFGDGSSESTKQRQMTHQYHLAGDYMAHAEISTQEGVRAVRPYKTQTGGQPVHVYPKVNQQSATKAPLPASSIGTAAPAATRSTKSTSSKKGFSTPDPTATPPWWIIDSIPREYVIPVIIVATLIVGYLLLKKKIEPDPIARPTFHLQLDHTTPQKPPQNMAINYELHFDPNLSQGSHELETNEANLIISRKKET